MPCVLSKRQGGSNPLVCFSEKLITLDSGVDLRTLWNTHSKEENGVQEIKKEKKLELFKRLELMRNSTKLLQL